MTKIQSRILQIIFYSTLMIFYIYFTANNSELFGQGSDNISISTIFNFLQGKYIPFINQIGGYQLTPDYKLTPELISANINTDIQNFYPYPTQYGLLTDIWAVIMGIIHFISPFKSFIGVKNAVHFLSICLSSIALFVFLWQVQKKFKTPLVLIFPIIFVFLGVSGIQYTVTSTYWNYGYNMIGMIIIFYAYEKYKDSLLKGFFIPVMLATFLNSLSGYEFLAVTVMGYMGLYAVLYKYDNKKIKLYLYSRLLLIIGIASISGFVLAILIHLTKANIADIYGPMSYRVGGVFSSGEYTGYMKELGKQSRIDIMSMILSALPTQQYMQILAVISCVLLVHLSFNFILRKTSKTALNIKNNILHIIFIFSPLLFPIFGIFIWIILVPYHAGHVLQTANTITYTGYTILIVFLISVYTENKTFIKKYWYVLLTLLILPVLYHSFKPLHELTAYNLTDRNWSNGISLHSTSFFAKNETLKGLKKGDILIFPYSGNRIIEKVISGKKYTNIHLTGKKLNPTKDGYPNTITWKKN